MMNTVGWREWVTLPELGISQLACKVDTGAKNSAIHAFEVEPFEQAGEQWVRFLVHVDENDLSNIKECKAKVVDEREVTDSSGNTQSRFFIRTPLIIGSQTFEIDISLTARDTMKYKMLLGRTALRTGKFVVNPDLSFLQGNPV